MVKLPPGVVFVNLKAAEFAKRRRVSEPNDTWLVDVGNRNACRSQIGVSTVGVAILEPLDKIKPTRR